MRARNYAIAASLFVLASCGAPAEMDDMRIAMDERLESGSSGRTPAQETAISLSEGLVPALRVAVATNEGYLGALALEAEAMGQVGVVASVRRPQLTGNANIGGIRETGSNADTTTGVAGGVNVSQLVYDGGASASAMNRTTALALSAQAGRVVQGNEIALSAARAWIAYSGASAHRFRQHAPTYSGVSAHL